MNGFSDLATADNFSTLNFIQISKVEALTKPSDPGACTIKLYGRLFYGKGEKLRRHF